MGNYQQLSVPSFFEPGKVSQVWKVPYQERADQAEAWAKRYGLTPAAKDAVKICTMIIDAQNTFCLPDFELYVGGQSGTGAIDDNVRLCEFIYRNLGVITEIDPTMDTHKIMQIFHPFFWINDAGQHPVNIEISEDDVNRGVWKVNPAVTRSLGGDYMAIQNFARHYVHTLQQMNKYKLYIWPYHGMLGGIGHALVSAVEEACFFHNIARSSQTGFQIKGGNPLTENYSVLAPEILTDSRNTPIAQRNTAFLTSLLSNDMVVIAGQAKSHCVAWTIDDLLTQILSMDPKLARKVYLLEDCTSPVVIPGIVDFTPLGEAAFKKFAEAGMHLVKSTTPISDWPESRL